MRLIPLVLTALLLCLPGLARGAVATGEAPPTPAGLEDQASLLMWGTWEALEAPEKPPEGLAKGEVPAGLWVAQVDLVAPAGEWSGISEVRVAGATACAGFPTGADPPESRSWSVSCARVGGEPAQGLRNTLHPEISAVSREYVSYTPYGELKAGPSNLDLGFQGLLKEARGEADEDGLLLAGLRHASSASGWVRRDPGGFIDGPNRYLWAFNNPLRYKDVSGLQGWEIRLQANRGVYDEARRTRLSPEAQDVAGRAGGRFLSVGLGCGVGALVGGGPLGCAAGGTMAGATHMFNESQNPTWSGREAMTSGGVSGFTGGLGGPTRSYTPAGASNAANQPAPKTCPNPNFRNPPLDGGTPANPADLGRLAGKRVRVSERGLDRVKEHLKRFDPVPQNQAMVNRLERSLNEGRPVTGADAGFYLHEVAESVRMGAGDDYFTAHSKALSKYQVKDFVNYHPEVVDTNPSMFNNNWRRFWGLGDN